MHKLKLYLDTSVISYLHQEDSPEKTKQTLEFWNILKEDRYKIYISDLVLSEINNCKEYKKTILEFYLAQINYEIISLSTESEKIAYEIIQEGILKKKNFDDCLHIAMAILNDCNFIVFWNFKHMVNLKTINGLRKIRFMKNNKSIDICTPYVLLIKVVKGEFN